MCLAGPRNLHRHLWDEVLMQLCSPVISGRSRSPHTLLPSGKSPSPTELCAAMSGPRVNPCRTADGHELTRGARHRTWARHPAVLAVCRACALCVCQHKLTPHRHHHGGRSSTQPISLATCLSTSPKYTSSGVKDTVFLSLASHTTSPLRPFAG